MIVKRTLPTLILLAVLGQGLYAAAKTGQTTDETAYAGTAYANLRYADYRFTGEHPPMSLHLGSIPLLFIQPAFPYKDPVLISQSGSEVDIAKNGAKFLYQMGNDAESLLFWQRVPIVLLMTVTGLGVFLWARKLFGYEGAVLSLSLYAFCPNILAHGSLFTTDFTLTAFFFFAAYALFLFFEKPSPGRAGAAGVLIGCAFLSKVSALALAPVVFLIFTAIFVFTEKSSALRLESVVREKYFYSAALFIFIMAFGNKVVMPVLGPLCLLALSWFPVMPLRERLKRFLKYGILLAGWIACGIYAVKLFRKYDGSVAAVIALWNLFVLGMMAAIHRGQVSAARQVVVKVLIGIVLTAALTLIAGYLDFFRSVIRFSPFDHFMRVFNVVLSHSSAGHTSCVEGSWIACDRRYFPSLLLVKTSVVVLGLAFAGIFIAGKKKTVSLFSKLALFLPPLCFFLMSVFLSKINIGLRHILPVYPFLFLYAGACAEAAGSFKIRWQRFSSAAFLTLAVLLYAGRTLSVSPHYLSYFSEWVGGPEEGAKLVSDSNINWGQDNRALAETVQTRTIPHIYIQSPQLNAELFDYYRISWEPVNTMDLKGLKPGYYAVSLDILQAHRKIPESPFNKLKPVFKAGETFLIYKIS